MKFIFNFTAFYYKSPVFYKISRISPNVYYAEPTDTHMKAFTIKKERGYWASEDGYTQRYALQIGQSIDKLQVAELSF